VTCCASLPRSAGGKLCRAFNLLGTPEALRQHVHDRGIYIVDTVAYVLKLGHGGGATDISQPIIRLIDLRHDCLIYT
jgi:hypothetical protein